MKKKKLALEKLSLKKSELLRLHARQQVTGGSGGPNGSVCATACHAITVNFKCPFTAVGLSCENC